MEPNRESTVVNPPATADQVPNTTTPTEAAPAPEKVPTNPAASDTAPEVVATSGPSTNITTPTTAAETATTSRSLPVDDPMAIIPADTIGPPPQYDDHQKDAITAPAPTLAPQADLKATTMNPHVPVAQRVIPLSQLGEEPRWIHCPFCYQEATTRVNKESTSETSMAAVCCCLFGGIICAFLPYCMQMCHDSHHFCTNCNAKVAIRPHDGPVQELHSTSAGPIVMAPGPIQSPEAVMKN